MGCPQEWPGHFARNFGIGLVAFRKNAQNRTIHAQNGTALSRSAPKKQLLARFRALSPSRCYVQKNAALSAFFGETKIRAARANSRKKTISVKMPGMAWSKRLKTPSDFGNWPVMACT